MTSCRPNVALSVSSIAPPMRRQDVLALAVEPRQPCALIRSHELRPRGFRKRNVELEMTRPRRLAVVRGTQTFLRILADRLQHPVAVAAGVQCDQRLLDELGDEVEHVALVEPIAGRDCFRGFQREAARKYREAAKQRALVLRRGGRSSSRSARAASAVAAMRCGRRRVSSRNRSSSRAAIALHGQRAHARRGKLDRQRNAVEAHGRCRPRPRVLVASPRNAGVTARRALDEQAHRRETARALSRRHVLPRHRDRERRRADRSSRRGC